MVGVRSSGRLQWTTFKVSFAAGVPAVGGQSDFSLLHSQTDAGRAGRTQIYGLRKHCADPQVDWPYATRRPARPLRGRPPYLRPIDRGSGRGRRAGGPSVWSAATRALRLAISRAMMAAKCFLQLTDP